MLSLSSLTLLWDTDDDSRKKREGGGEERAIHVATSDLRLADYIAEEFLPLQQTGKEEGRSAFAQKLFRSFLNRLSNILTVKWEINGPRIFFLILI